MKFRKIVATLGAAVMGLSLASCKDGGGDEETPVMVKVGIGYNVEPNLTTLQNDVVGVFAAFNAETGVVEACRFDCVQTKVEFTSQEFTAKADDVVEVSGVNYLKSTLKATKEGDTTTYSLVEGGDANKNVVVDGNSKYTLYGIKNKVATEKLNADGSVKTKCELAKDYGNMGGQKGQVDLQIEAFAKFCVGKTIPQIMASIGSNSKPADEALKASASIKLAAYADAIQVAYLMQGTETYEFAEGAKAGVAIIGKPAYNYGSPSVEVSHEICGALVVDGTVIAAAIDSVVVDYTFTTQAASHSSSNKYIATGWSGIAVHTGGYISKKALKDGYAMKVASPIHAEWFTQAASFEAFCVGKTAEQISGAAAADLKAAGMTITSSSYTAGVAKAVGYAALEHIGPQA